jgi:hypothetical protein
MDLATSDLHNFADWHRFVTTKIEHTLQHQICVETSGAEGGCITGLERKCEQGSGIERTVMIGITWQDKTMSERF